MEILAKLFGGPQRVKLLRLFVFNPEAIFDSRALSTRAKVTPAHVRREVAAFKAIRLIRPKSELQGSGKTKKRVSGWQLNPAFPYTQELRELLAGELFPDHQAIARRFGRAGKLQVVAIGGVFLRDDQGYIDLVLVGENLNRQSVERIVKIMESEIGKEINYAVFDAEDFLYRYHSSDKFVRDLLDHPHEFLVDKLNLA